MEKRGRKKQYKAILVHVFCHVRVFDTYGRNNIHQSTYRVASVSHNHVPFTS